MTRSRASPEAELAYLTYFDLQSVEDWPELTSHVIAWRLGMQWVAYIPVRYAQEPVELLAVPAGALDLEALRLAPGGGEAVVSVTAVGSRARC